MATTPARKTAGHDLQAPRGAYAFAATMLGLALAFPVALMVFNPTLMFERGWHQYAGTTFYAWAVFLLGREWLRLRRNEAEFARASILLKAAADGEGVPATARGILPDRLRQLDGHARGQAAPTVGQLMELNREVSGLDQERASGRFTLTKYILYLMPVIGFIGTVEGISHALLNISRVLPMVKELDGFLNNLTSVTHALQIAFDSTLLALFLSAALMFVQTVVYRLAEDQLARVDAWVVEHVLPALGRPEGPAESLAPYFEQLKESIATVLAERLGGGFAPSVERFALCIDRLPGVVEDMRKGSEAIGRAGADLSALGQLDDSIRRLHTGLGRIESTLETRLNPADSLEPIRRGLDRTTAAVESLADQWASAYERSSRSTQEQLARTLGSLKDALELINVSMDQSNTLYRSIVKRLFEDRAGASTDSSHRAA
jgi:biopolymer transport protein ExbB/TolQ